MSEGWRDVRLEEVAADITVGHVGPMAAEYVPTGIPFLRSHNVQPLRVNDSDLKFIAPSFHERLRKSALTPGDVVIVRTGKPGTCAVIPESLPVANCSDLVIVRCGPDLDPRFLAYYVNSVAAQHVDAYLVGAVQQHFNVGSARILVLHLPRVTEQRAIASILGTLDDKIELNRRINVTLEAMLRALFTSWFVDFDPVRAKAEGRVPDLSKPLADLFPDSLEDSELGEIPKGWTVTTVEAIAARVGMGPFGSSIKVSSFVPQGVPVISGQHLRGFVVEDTTFDFVSEDHADRLKAATVQRGDVVFTHAGNIGQVAYVPTSSRYERYVISQRQFFMRCDLAQVTPTFVAFYFRSVQGRHRLLANASSSGVPSIARPVTYLRSIPLTIPPKPIMAAFETLTQPLLTQFGRNRDESSTLEELRDTLLPRLISGELRLRDPERIMEGAN
jgi:type I restriction enzyme S subunit